MKIHDEKETLEKLVYKFKHNNKIFQIQNVTKVSGFLTENDGIKLVDFVLFAVAEALIEDPQSNLLIEKMHPIPNYDFASKLFLPNPWEYEYDFPYSAKKKGIRTV